MIPWQAPTGRLTGEVVVPGSKSETNRALVLAALADGPGTIKGGLVCRDTDLMIAALGALGVSIEVSAESWQVTPPARFQPGGSIDCGLAGTVMRFVPPVAALTGGRTRFFGDDQASARPMAPILDGLRQLGVLVSGDELPFDLDASAALSGREISINSQESSQFVSGLLLAGARYPNGIALRHEGGPLPSLPHIDMTVRMLAERGVNIVSNGESWIVSPGPIAAREQQIEPDLTNASVFLAGAALSGGEVSVTGWPGDSTQPGALFLQVLGQFGVTHELTTHGLRVQGAPRLAAIDVDLRAAAELVPVVAAMAAFAEGTSRIRGVGHIRGHETDRLAALTTELGKLGVAVSETEDGLEIVGGTPQPGQFATYADHRMAHAGALVGLRVSGVVLDDVGCTSKTMPTFSEMWTTCVR